MAVVVFFERGGDGGWGNEGWGIVYGMGGREVCPVEENSEDCNTYDDDLVASDTLPSP